MSPRMLVLFVDALGWQLAGRDPSFLPELPHRRALGTILGFSSGALPTAFTGALPREHGRWLMYRRASGPGAFAGFDHLRWLPARLRRSWRLTGVLTSLVRRRGVRGYFNLYDVPRDELARFDLPERDDIFAPGGLPLRSLWDDFEELGVRWRGWNWRTPEARAFDELEASLEQPELDVLFLYTADLDALLHHEGSRGARVRERLGVYGQRVRRALAASARAGRELRVYVCSDHGMVDVTRTVDVMAAVDATGLTRGREFVAFYDSTFARFWWREPRAREAVHRALVSVGGGRWLTASELADAGADFPDQRYGEDLWLADPGVLLVPSFMGSRPLAAMHGYDAGHPDMLAMLASNRPLPESVRHLTDLRGFLRDEAASLRRVAA